MYTYHFGEGGTPRDGMNSRRFPFGLPSEATKKGAGVIGGQSLTQVRLEVEGSWKLCEGTPDLVNKSWQTRPDSLGNPCTATGFFLSRWPIHQWARDWDCKKTPPKPVPSVGFLFFLLGFW